jgi:hypothetical protein
MMVLVMWGFELCGVQHVLNLSMFVGMQDLKHLGFGRWLANGQWGENNSIGCLRLFELSLKSMWITWEKN